MFGLAWFEFGSWFFSCRDAFEIALLGNVTALGAVAAQVCLGAMIISKTVYKMGGVVRIGGIFARSLVEFSLRQGWAVIQFGTGAVAK